MLFLLSFATVLSTVSALIPRDSETSGARNKDLHILPLGASITYGLQSSNGNGYREDLRTLLSPISVTYVGSQCSGSMINGNSEGHPGFVIPQMESVATPDLVDKPNVVLVYVGTNDMKFGDAKQAPDNMKKLVSFLIDKLPGALIVVSKLFLNADSGVQKRIEAFNDKVSEVEQLGNVLIADMSSALSASDLSSDGTHPNDGGYAKMAKVFDAVLVKAEQQGRILSPEKTTKQLKICNGPVSTESQTLPHTSMTISSGSNSGTKTSKAAKNQSTVSAPTKTHSSGAQSQLSSKFSASPVSRNCSARATTRRKSSTVSVASKSKSTTCHSKKSEAHSTKPTEQSAKAIAHTTTLPLSQNLPVDESMLTADIITTSSDLTLSAKSSVSSLVGVSTALSSPQSTSQANSPSPALTSNPTTSSTLASSDSETVGAAYPTTTTSNSSSIILGSTASVSVTLGSLSSQDSNTADGNSELQASSSPSAIAYSFVGNTSNSSSVTFSSGGSGTTETFFFGLIISTFSLLIMF